VWKRNDDMQFGAGTFLLYRFRRERQLLLEDVLPANGSRLPGQVLLPVEDSRGW
jgi:hypothetical protein